MTDTDQVTTDLSKYGITIREMAEHDNSGLETGRMLHTLIVDHKRADIIVLHLSNWLKDAGDDKLAYYIPFAPNEDGLRA